jgi:hypothetical protein
MRLREVLMAYRKSESGIIEAITCDWCGLEGQGKIYWRLGKPDETEARTIFSNCQACVKKFGGRKIHMVVEDFVGGTESNLSEFLNLFTWPSRARYRRGK